MNLGPFWQHVMNTIIALLNVIVITLIYLSLLMLPAVDCRFSQDSLEMHLQQLW